MWFGLVGYYPHGFRYCGWLMEDLHKNVHKLRLRLLIKKSSACEEFQKISAMV